MRRSGRRASAHRVCGVGAVKLYKLCHTLPRAYSTLPLPADQDDDGDLTVSAPHREHDGRLPFKTLGSTTCAMRAETSLYALSHDFRKNQCPEPAVRRSTVTLGQLTLLERLRQRRSSHRFRSGQAIQVNRDPTSASVHNDP